MTDLRHTDPAAVTAVHATRTAPRYGQTATGYGRKIPTRYTITYRGRVRRVYAMVYGNAGSVYILERGAVVFLDTDTEHRLESAPVGDVAPRYPVTRDSRTGEISSTVPGWIVTYPAACNGALGDLGFVASRGYGGSGFVHFDPGTGEPYGMPLTVAARDRLRAMRRDFRGELETLRGGAS